MDRFCKLQLPLDSYACGLILQCDITVIGGNGIENVNWDMTKLEVGMLDYDLKQGFKTDAIDIECGEGWVNPARKGDPWYMEGTFAEAFPWNL